MSGLRRDDKLYPVITLVFYYGEAWDAAAELHDMFAVQEQLGKGLLEKYVSNYHINLVNPIK